MRRLKESYFPILKSKLIILIGVYVSFEYITNLYDCKAKYELVIDSVSKNMVETCLANIQSCLSKG